LFRNPNIMIGAGAKTLSRSTKMSRIMELLALKVRPRNTA
jgi:hypothetical protein